MNLNLDNKKALVLSSSKGIGFAIAKALVFEGCHVTITSSSKKKFNKGKEKNYSRNRSRS